MRFEESHLSAFARLSWDTNPLHVDRLYAGRTHFGQRVVYGVAATLVALGRYVAAGHRVRIAHLRCAFRKPLFIGPDYELSVRDAPDRTVLRWLHDGVPQSDIVITWATDVECSDEKPRGPFAPRGEARDGSAASLPKALDYDIADEADLLSTLGLEPRALPREQVRTLAGLSYLVGMECPGRQALFSNLEVTFPQEPSRSGGHFFQDLSAALDERFDRLQVRGKTARGATFNLAAFVRPRPADESIDDVAARMGPRPASVGKRVLVTGASRGFGAAVAKAFAVDGANVVVHCHTQLASGASVVAEAQRFGQATLLQGDLASDAGAKTFVEAVVATAGVPDLVVLNATPPIDQCLTKALSARELSSFVGRSLALVHAPLRQLVGQMTTGTVAVISSVYVTQKPEAFGHYVAAKAAIEALIAVVAKEHPKIRMVIVRPPPMLTDQTNVTGRAAVPLASPAEVAVRLVAALQGSESIIEL